MFDRYCSKCETGYFSKDRQTCPKCNHPGWRRDLSVISEEPTKVHIEFPDDSVQGDPVNRAITKPIFSSDESPESILGSDLNIKLLQQLVSAQILTNQKLDKLISEQQKTRFYIRWGFGVIGFTLLLAFYVNGVKVTIFRQFP